MHHAGLLTIGVAAALIGMVNHIRRIPVGYKSIGTIVERLARQGGVIGIHHAMHKAHSHPLSDQGRTPIHITDEHLLIPIGMTAQVGI